MAKTKLTEFDKYKLLPDLLVVYEQLLKKLAENGLKWVQIDEPMLGLDLEPKILALFNTAYQKLKQNASLNVLLTTYFTGLYGENLKVICKNKNSCLR